MIQHFVFFKFKEGTSTDAIQQHLDMFGSLKDQIPQIVAYDAGEAIAGEQPRRYDTAHYVTFQNKDDLAIYLPHPAHQAFIATNKPNWQEILVIDSKSD